MPDKSLVDLFIPCFIDQIYPETGFNMVKVLEKVGCKVNYNPAQTCCGQTAFNAGHWNDAFEVASKFIRDFSNDRFIVCPSASCTGMIRNYYNELFQHSSLYNPCKQIQRNLFEFTEFLTDVLGVTDVGAEFNGTATYHDSCSALRECGIKDAPRKLLSHVKGLKMVEMKDTETCCGFGGTFAVKFEPISVAMGEQKIQHALDTQAEYLISTDLSCLMHLDAYIQKNNLKLKVLHIADVLANNA